MSIGLDDLRAWATALPEVEEGSHFGLPSFKVRGRPFAGPEKGLATVVASISEDDARVLVAEAPEIYEEVWRPGGPHGRIFVGVRIDLAAATPDGVRALIEEAWRHKAPKRLRATFDAAR